MRRTNDPSLDIGDNFRAKVLKVVCNIPAGETLSYGEVALLAGSPRAARVVGGILAGLKLSEAKIPWWRVINKQGFISIRGEDPRAKDIQRDLLREEGLEVNDEYYVVFKRNRN
jgi:methylated-DNA-protein-cysteine methyltransferase-like protein